MTTDIYEILSSKPHNPHQLNRYWKFIQSCQIKNQNLDPSTYSENHHICPKADDLFPEYIDLRKNPWNKVCLTARQHIVAHLILHKIFSGSQTRAIYSMISRDIRLERKDELDRWKYRTKYLAKLRKEYSEWRKCRATYKDSTGKKYYLLNTDSLIEELGLVGWNAGLQMTDESRKTMSEVRIKNCAPHHTIMLYLLNCKPIKKKLSDPGFVEWLEDHLAQGWTYKKTAFDSEYSKNIANQEHSERLSGTANYMYPDGSFYGKRLDKNDPIIEELGLEFLITDLHREQWKRRVELATEAKLGSNTYNNGIEEIKRKTHPGEGWNLGRLPRTESHRSAQRLGVQKACLGKKFWNDGTHNYRLGSDETPESHWVPGMKPRKSLKRI